MKKFLFVTSAILFIFTMAFVSCKKTDSAPVSVNPDTSASAGGDHTVAIQSLSDADNSSQNNLNSSGTPSSGFAMHANQIMGENLHASGGLMTDVTGSGSVNTNDSSTIAPKPIVKVGANGDSVTFTGAYKGHPGVALMDFGRHGVKAADGKLRMGQIINHFVHKFTDANFSDTIKFSNYSIDGKQVEGTIILTRTSDTTITRQIIGGKITYVGGLSTKISGTSTHIYSKVIAAGAGLDHTLKIKEYGVFNDISRAGVISTATTVAATPLVYDFSCNGAFPISGIVDFSSSFYKNDRIVDFGASASDPTGKSPKCDLTYKITIGTYTAFITASN